MHSLILAAPLVFLAGVAGAQTTPVGRDISTTGLPPNAIDRALDRSSVQADRADAAAQADRLRAENAARDAAARRGPVTGSTLTDGDAGLDTRTDLDPPRG